MNCIVLCDSIGFLFAGIEFGQECCKSFKYVVSLSNYLLITVHVEFLKIVYSNIIDFSFSERPSVKCSIPCSGDQNSLVKV